MILLLLLLPLATTKTGTALVLSPDLRHPSRSPVTSEKPSNFAYYLSVLSPLWLAIWPFAGTRQTRTQAANYRKTVARGRRPKDTSYDTYIRKVNSFR